MQDAVLMVAELAEHLRVRRATIYKLLKGYKIPAFKIGSDWPFNHEQIDQWRVSQNSGWIGDAKKSEP